MIDFSNVIIGKDYDRPTLARMWGYESHHAIDKGVVTPKGENQIILFITKEKQKEATQYQNSKEQDILFWEGEKGHGNDKRIILQKDFIYVFYRERHHSSFVYQGRAHLRSLSLEATRPSKFTFYLVDQKVSAKQIVEEVEHTYGLTETEKEAIIKSRRGQGLYRRKTIELWKGCSVTGFTKKSILIASHIKPWKVSTNEERITAYNSLLLVPTLDRLFEKGFVGFEHSGKILLSNKMEQDNWDRAGIDNSMRLRSVPDGIKKYLDYHAEYIFDLVDK